MTARIPAAFLDAIRARIDLRRLVGRSMVLKPASGGEWKGLCPFHAERTPSFHVVPGKGFYHCFGCGAHGSCFDWMTAFEGYGFLDAVALLAAEANLPLPADAAGLRERAGKLGVVARRGPPRRPVATPDPAAEEHERVAKINAARRIWQRGQSIGGTLAETYLRGRGCAPPGRELPPTLRYVPGLDYFDRGADGRQETLTLPAMVGLVTATCAAPDGAADAAAGAGGSVLVGVHRTFLKVDGRGKAGVSSPKKMLGACWGGAVRLGPATRRLGLCEGIETGLSIVSAVAQGTFGWLNGPEAFSIWCCLSLGGIGAVHLPATVEALTIFADNDNKDPDKAARFLRIGIDRHRRQGRTVTVLRPPRGDDFNDWWLSRCGEAA